MFFFSWKTREIREQTLRLCIRLALELITHLHVVLRLFCVLPKNDPVVNRKEGQ
jgi:hypothetical protein